MTRFHPLSRFMPYGAPDLLASAEPRLTRAVLAGSLTMIAAFFVAMVSIPDGIETPVKIVPHHLIPYDEPPPVYQVPPEAEPAPVKPMADDLGKIEPVIDERPIEWQDSRSGAMDDPTGVGTGEGLDVVTPPGEVGPPAEVLPERGVWVHVDQLPEAAFEFKPE